MSARQTEHSYYCFRDYLRDVRAYHLAERELGMRERMQRVSVSLEFRQISALQNARALAVLCYAILPLLLIALLAYLFRPDGVGPVAGTLVMLYIPVSIWLGWRAGTAAGIRRQRELQHKGELTLLFGPQEKTGTPARPERSNDNN